MQLKIYLLFLITFITTNAFAQKQNVYFLAKAGKEVRTRDSAEIIRVVSEPDSGNNLNLREYYKNGKIKLVSQTSTIPKITYEGICMYFYPSGKRARIETYIHGNRTGDIYEYYQNGLLYRIIQQTRPRDIPVPNYPVCGEYVSVVKSMSDSIGNVTFKNGNGYYIDYYSDFKHVYEEGMIQNDKKTGRWIGIGSERDSLKSFTEKYNEGKLIEGTAIHENGNSYNYKQRYIPATITGGAAALYYYIKNHTTYPRNALKNKIEGSVYASFNVEINGAISNLNLRSSDEDLKSEVFRAIKNMPKWQSAIEFGQLKRTHCVLPFYFELIHPDHPILIF